MINEKNIIIVYDYASINGGAAKVAIQSAIALSKCEGVNVYFFSAVGPVCKELESSNVEVVCLDDFTINTNPSKLSAAINGIWNTKTYNELKRFLEKFDNKNTVIHFHGWTKALSVSVIDLVNIKGFKSVVTLHEYFAVCPNGGFYNYKKNKICKKVPMSLSCIFCNCDKRNYLHKLWRCCRQVVQDLFLKCKKEVNYIYISNFSYKILSPYLRSNRMFYVHNLVDLYENIAVKAWENNYYICISRIASEKGVDLFCKAMDRLGLPGIVIGDGNLKEAMMQEYKNIKFVGWKEKKEILHYVLDARAVVYPSKCYETAGLVVLEMMSCGLPCIVPDECSASEYVVDNINGVIFKTGDIDDLVTKITLLNNDKVVYDLSTNIKNNFERNLYNEKTYVSKLLEVYDGLLRE